MPERGVLALILRIARISREGLASLLGQPVKKRAYAGPIGNGHDHLGLAE